MLFDSAKVSGQSLTIRYAKEGEKVNTLDEKTHTLNDTMVVIADASKPVAIAGVMVLLMLKLMRVRNLLF